MSTKTTRGRKTSPSRKSKSPRRSSSPARRSSSPTKRESSAIYLRSPKTGYWIKEGGETYNALMADSDYADKLKTAERREEGKLSPHRGQSNRGKYTAADAPFCGPNQTYPVNTRARYRAAMSYARFAENPEEIRDCARKVAESKGWRK